MGRSVIDSVLRREYVNLRDDAWYIEMPADCEPCVTAAVARFEGVVNLSVYPPVDIATERQYGNWGRVWKKLGLDAGYVTSIFARVEEEQE